MSAYALAGVVSLLLLVSLAGAGLAAAPFAELSVLVSAFVSALLSLFVTALLSDLAESSAATLALLDFRLSVIYQPEPLNTMPTG